jgi:acetyl-CoA carboxylase biotin carboxyl carrier protein
MEFKELQNLIKLINSTDLTEFRMKEGDFELLIRTKDYHKAGKQTTGPVIQAPVVTAPAVPGVAPEIPAVAPAPAAQSMEAPAVASGESGKDSKLIDIKSPIVGTFYRSPSPDKEPYVKIGDHIDVGSVVCIVEAMKLFNEIESEVSGKIVEIVAEDSSPVEYDQVLFRVQPA